MFKTNPWFFHLSHLLGDLPSFSSLKYDRFDHSENKILIVKLRLSLIRVTQNTCQSTFILCFRPTIGNCFNIDRKKGKKHEDLTLRPELKNIFVPRNMNPLWGFYLETDNSNFIADCNRGFIRKNSQKIPFVYNNTFDACNATRREYRKALPKAHRNQTIFRQILRNTLTPTTFAGLQFTVKNRLRLFIMTTSWQLRS